LGFLIFKTKAEGNSNKAKIFLDFSNSKLKVQVKQTADSKLKKQIERNNGNIFGLFVFWKVEIKARSNKVKRKRNMDIQ
jgi:hypothetical protein